VGFVGDTQTRAINRYRNRTLDRVDGEMVGISLLPEFGDADWLRYRS
jgi:hypothetical protein